MDPGEPLVEEDLSAFVSKQTTQYLEFPFPENVPPDQQKTVKLWYWKVTRGMRQRAVDKATMAFYLDHKELSPEDRIGFYPSILERELAVQSIKKWNLPGSPAQSWDLIDAALGDLIVKRLDLLAQATGTKAVQEGKNSPAGAATPEPTSNSPSTSSTTSSSTPESSV